MISLLLAAMVSPPLDGTYSTAGDPKAHGFNLSFSYPSSWTITALNAPDGVRRISSPDGAAHVLVWVRTERLVEILHDATQGSENVQLGPFFDSGKLERSVLAGNQLTAARTIFVSGRHARVVEYTTAQGTREVAAILLNKGSPVIVVFGVSQGNRYEQFSPLFAGMIKSMQLEEEQEPEGFGYLLVIASVAGVLIGAMLLYRRSTRRTRP